MLNESMESYRGGSSIFLKGINNLSATLESAQNNDNSNQKFETYFYQNSDEDDKS